jgi:hypothetical protein
MRGLQSVATGQRLLEGIELAHTIRRGHVGATTAQGNAGRHLPPHERPREAVDSFTWLAKSLVWAA